MRSEVSIGQQQQFIFSTITNEVRVNAQPMYLEEQSNPALAQYVWAYRIRIRNDSARPIKLVSRHWVISDSNGYTFEVEGEGVVGEQPVIRQGEEYEYSSYTSLTAACGIMAGFYTMREVLNKKEGVPFEVLIPAISLDSPVQMLLPN